MHVLLTVGSTHFDELVNECLSKSVLDVLQRRGVSSFSIQCGKYDIESRLGKNADGVWRLQDAGIQMEIWRYKPTLNKEYNRADLVISHAGSGTILDVLRLRKPLVVISNPTLLDDHQSDLASELDKSGHLKASTVKSLAADLETFDFNSLKPFPKMEPTKFRSILDEEMGFI
ncbi:glycosyltransferase family 1 [Pyrrhoderma noxium]|uniref:UDP-N-acetylglucosamine transferase subunit ALG13 n=1 Tax=Pyrrhoderma noxium TaxID=2282107 RepID=A0A286UW50_9AGAM|nr:glycosyltransferase family 1 [Pyrrhoderma noxium]